MQVMNNFYNYIETQTKIENMTINQTPLQIQITANIIGIILPQCYKKKMCYDVLNDQK